MQQHEIKQSIPRLRFERRRLYAQARFVRRKCGGSTVRAEALGAVLRYIKRNRKEKQHD